VRARQALDRYKAGARTMEDDSYVSVMTKADEVLFKLKGRAIQNASTLSQAQWGPMIMGVSKRLHAESYRGITAAAGFRWYYASSFTDADLTRVHRDIDVEEYSYEYEADVSMFDQSESFGPLNFEFAALIRLGAPLPMVEDLRAWMFSLKLVTPFGVLALDPMRITGGCDTSVGNGIVNAAMYLRAHQMMRERHPYSHSVVLVAGDDSWARSTHPLPLAEAAEELGFKLKLKAVPMGMGTFLKGIWYPVEGEETSYWGPLPSRILKTGKTLSNPKSFGPTLREGCLAHAGAVAHSYAAFLQIPVLRVYVQKWRHVDRQTLSRYAVQADGKFSDLVVAEERTIAMLSRLYDVPAVWWSELETLLEEQDLFETVSHPLLDAMVNVDYCPEEERVSAPLRCRVVQ